MCYVLSLRLRYAGNMISTLSFTKVHNFLRCYEWSIVCFIEVGTPATAKVCIKEKYTTEAFSGELISLRRNLEYVSMQTCNYDI